MPKHKFPTLAIAVILLVHISAGNLFAQTNRIALGPQDAKTEPVTRQETLRGSITPEREWWDVLHYQLQVEFLPETKRLKGSNTITFKTLKPGNKMQIDLQPPLAITKIIHADSQPRGVTGGTAVPRSLKFTGATPVPRSLKFEREGNVYWVTFEKEIPQGVEDKIEIFYEGVPTVSRNPPWVGEITWGRDDLGEHFSVTTCQRSEEQRLNSS